MNFIRKLFKSTKPEIKYKSIDSPDLYKSKWVEFSKEKPPHEVVLAACDTYDCGWTMDTAWWYEDKQCWMITGAAESIEAHLPYTHWRKLPDFP